MRLGQPRQRPLPKHPYRDSALVYGALAAVLLGVSVLTGRSTVRSVVIAVLFFLGATAWAWYRFRQRIERERA